MSFYISFLRALFLLSLCLLALFKLQAAEVDIKGIENERVLKNVRAHIQSLDIPTASYQFGHYQESLLSKVEAAIQVFGYYQATTIVSAPSIVAYPNNAVALNNAVAPNIAAGPSIIPSNLAKNKNWILEVELGPITLVRQLSIKIEGEGAQG